uniref:Transposase IS116/IS110/IS902 C-terminal domain-containing protein n=1 Tax=Streptomyces albus subsp. albus TaxID=67257 RepID=W5QK46_9ACTN|nr:hypothetical protein [Streptomyces albus subsp. albus]
MARLAKWPANRKVRNARALAEAAVEAAEHQSTVIPGEGTMDKPVEGRFRKHELADIVLGVPGIGIVLGAELLAAVGGGLDEFDSPDALAAFACVAPRPATRARSAATSTGRSHTTEGSRGSSTPPRWSASAATPTRGSSTTANAPREEARPGRARPRPSTRQRSVGPDP